MYIEGIGILTVHVLYILGTYFLSESTFCSGTTYLIIRVIGMLVGGTGHHECIKYILDIHT